ncbi:MAG: hypothetical protein V2A58_11475 [Planctomycetota bacterium]
MISVVSSFFTSSYAAIRYPAVLSLALICVTSPVLAAPASLPADDPLSRLPADVLLAVQIRSPRDVSPKLEELLRQLSPSSAPPALSFGPESFAGLDGARSAVFLLFDVPVSGPLSFAFVVPVTDYSAFLHSDSLAQISPLPTGADEVQRPGGRKLYAAALPQARAAVCSSPELALRLRDFPAGSPSALSRFHIAPAPGGPPDVTLILFPKRALPALAPRLDSLRASAGADRHPLLAAALPLASAIDFLNADFTLASPSTAEPTTPGAPLSIRAALRPLPDSFLARFLAAFSSARASEPAQLWTDNTLACVTWNLAPAPSHSNDLKDLLLALYDLARPPSRRRGTASEPASLPTDTANPDRDLFAGKSLASLASFPGTGGASFLTAERAGELGAFLWEHCDDPTLDTIDRVAQHWLPVANGLLARFPSHSPAVYAPRAGEYLGRVASVLSLASPSASSSAPALPRGSLFGSTDAVCLAWNLPPASADGVLALIPRPPATRPASPQARDPAVRLLASLRDLALARRPDSPRKQALAAAARNPATAGLAGPGLSASLNSSGGDLFLEINVNLGDLAIALSALSSLPESASP